MLAWFSAHHQGKFVTLANHLGCGRGALSSSLSHLIELGLLRRNTGLGHPLRPEYLMTDNAADLASACASLHQQVQAWNCQGLAYRKWSLPLVVAVDRCQRFNDLKQSLMPITPRALALGLAQLEKCAWVARQVTHHYPPITQYSLRSRGRQLCQALGPISPFAVS